MQHNAVSRDPDHPAQPELNRAAGARQCAGECSSLEAVFVLAAVG
jgi:hypothetical protein